MKKLLTIGFLIWWVFYLAFFVFGCQQPIQLNPIEGHIYCVPEGIELETDNSGTVTTKHPGVWMSDWYLGEEVVGAKVEELK